MNKNRTFNPKNWESINKLSDQLYNCNSNEVSDDFLRLNLRKLVNALKKIELCDYETIHSKNLLRLMCNISLFCETAQILDEIIELDLHSIFSAILTNQLDNNKFRYSVIDAIYSTLINLTGESTKIAKQNLERGFCQITIGLLDHLSLNVLNTIKDSESFGLYDVLITFLLNNAYQKDLRDSLRNTELVGRLSNELNKLNDIKGLDFRIKYVMLNIIRTIAFLLSDNELAELPVSNDTVDQFVIALRECVNNSKIKNQLVSDTKFYADYTIGSLYSYSFASDYLQTLRLLAVNNSVNQRLIESDILKSIEEILINGNDKERCCCIDLLCLLCFNENTIIYLKDSLNLQNIIKNVRENTKEDTTRYSCHQIQRMLANWK